MKVVLSVFVALRLKICVVVQFCLLITYLDFLQNCLNRLRFYYLTEYVLFTNVSCFKFLKNRKNIIRL